MHPQGKRLVIAKNIPMKTLELLMAKMEEKYNIGMNDIEIRPSDVSQYTRTSESNTEQDQLDEFAPSDNGGEEPDEYEILHRLASMWWNGTEQQMIKAQRTLEAMGWEIGEDEGYDDGGVFVVRAGDEHGKSYISWPHEDLQLDESTSKVIAKTAKDLVNPPKIMQHRAKRDQEREVQYRDAQRKIDEDYLDEK
jgi:hypothetical protein